MKRSALLFCALLLVGIVHAQDAPRVTLHTSMGDITLELYPDKAPITVENFLEYARSGFYNDTIFHRVISRFVVQGGGFTPDMEQKPTRDPIANESANRLRNEHWTVAMARTADPDSATSQFYINLAMNLSLDYRPRTPGYTVFGKVIDGQHVVRNISNVETDNVDGMADVPVEPVILKRVSIVSGDSD